VTFGWPTYLLVEPVEMTWHRAEILRRWQLSPKVTGISLHLTESKFSFVPGQWLDFKPLPSSTWSPPERQKIGGYSITSIPSDLPLIDLAIQSSRHPVASWACAESKVGDLIDIRVGGTFVYKEGGGRGDDPEWKPRRILFTAGGVGINPLFSMIKQWHEDDDGDSRAVLLYSCKERGDFLFLGEIEKMLVTESRLRVVCTTTADDVARNRQTDEQSAVVFRHGGIDLGLIHDSMSWLNCGDASKVDKVFVCGPPGMAESLEEVLVSNEIAQKSDILFEKWW